jgi:hypothetical protein
VLIVAMSIPACGTTHSTLRVNEPLTSRSGGYKSVQIQCTAENEKDRGKEFTGRFETQILVKLKERETLQEYRLSKDEDPSDLTLKVVILDMKQAGGWGWYGRSSSKVSCDVQMLDAKTDGSIGPISIVAKPKYSHIEQALGDAATQIAEYMRENK